MIEEPKTVSRAEFLKSVGRTAAFIGAGGATYTGWSQLTSRLRTLDPLKQVKTTGPKYGMAIDVEKCIGCGLCVQACSKENNVPEGHYRTWIERYVVKKDGEIIVSSPDGGINGFQDDIPDEDVERAYFVPKLCNQCEHSPCTQVCPVGATFETAEGAVVIDYDWCIGCGYCIQACPYGTRFWNPVTKTADKCTLCYHRITKGQIPACAEICPTKARLFGDLNDQDSEISKFMRANPTEVLKPHLETGAKVAYKGLSKEVL